MPISVVIAIKMNSDMIYFPTMRTVWSTHRLTTLIYLVISLFNANEFSF